MNTATGVAAKVAEVLTWGPITLNIAATNQPNDVAASHPAYQFGQLKQTQFQPLDSPVNIHWVPDARGFGLWTRHDSLALSLITRVVLSPHSAGFFRGQRF
ncbi:hypothetical protein GCM10023063_42730 [Arthrobacter methylotrophus]|uniref:Uncharacterized protein n=1 Tax=Arthrobacter methylotrophus TaxID=121291 RepID=A0ABV5UXF8_9MICC